VRIASTSETSVYLSGTAWHYVPERYLHAHHNENFKFLLVQVNMEKEQLMILFFKWQRWYEYCCWQNCKKFIWLLPNGKSPDISAGIVGYVVAFGLVVSILAIGPKVRGFKPGWGWQRRSAVSQRHYFLRIVQRQLMEHLMFNFSSIRVHSNATRYFQTIMKPHYYVSEVRP
jgi:hypothetical protein